jgi:hypothetical protein
MRPFNIVKDHGFNCLMKTGRPNYYLPSGSTVACDVKTVFARTRQRIAKMLQVFVRFCGSIDRKLMTYLRNMKAL